MEGLVEGLAWGQAQSNPHPLDHVHVLLRGAEVAGEVGDAERFVLADAHPALVLHRARDAVQEDPEGLPHRLLADWG